MNLNNLSALGLAQGPLGPQELNSFHQAQQSAALYEQMTQLNKAYDALCERERFYRSCSRHWLNAMLDIELGI